MELQLKSFATKKPEFLNKVFTIFLDSAPNHFSSSLALSSIAHTSALLLQDHTHSEAQDRFLRVGALLCFLFIQTLFLQSPAQILLDPLDSS